MRFINQGLRVLSNSAVILFFLTSCQSTSNYLEEEQFVINKLQHELIWKFSFKYPISKYLDSSSISSKQSVTNVSGFDTTLLDSLLQIIDHEKLVYSPNYRIYLYKYLSPPFFKENSKFLLSSDALLNHMQWKSVVENSDLNYLFELQAFYHSLNIPDSIDLHTIDTIGSSNELFIILSRVIFDKRLRYALIYVTVYESKYLYFLEKYNSEWKVVDRIKIGNS